MSVRDACACVDERASVSVLACARVHARVSVSASASVRARAYMFVFVQKEQLDTEQVGPSIANTHRQTS